MTTGAGVDITTYNDDTSSQKPDNSMTLNEAREMIFGLLWRSTILDECRVRVGEAITKSVAKRTVESMSCSLGTSHPFI